jgi:hypothetical protein
VIINDMKAGADLIAHCGECTLWCSPCFSPRTVRTALCHDNLYFICIGRFCSAISISQGRSAICLQELASDVRRDRLCGYRLHVKTKCAATANMSAMLLEHVSNCDVKRLVS